MKYLIPILCAVALFGGCTGKKDAGVDTPDVVDAPQPAIEAPPAAVEAPKVVVDGAGIEERRDGFWYFEGKPFTGFAVIKYPNGQKDTEGTYKDGKEHGLWTGWYENGQKRGELTWKDGKRHGLWTGWYENGQKRGEATWKDGKRHGLATMWHENGQKQSEKTYKDGKEISKKEWDEDGNQTYPKP